MTWALVKRALDAPVGGLDQLILIHMANHANATSGQCWASLATLADKSGVSARNVSRVINRLETAGYLARETSPGKRTTYTLLDPPTSDTVSEVPLTHSQVCHSVTSDTVSYTSDTVSDEPLNNPLSKERTPCKSPKPKTNEHFSRWWSAYPNKKAKKTAERIWKNRGLDAIADQLIDDTMKRKSIDDGWLRGYVPMPTTYLNGDRWHDDIEKPKRNGGARLTGPERVRAANAHLLGPDPSAHGSSLGEDEQPVRKPLDGEFWHE